MAVSGFDPSKTEAWNSLHSKAKEVEALDIAAMLAADPMRVEKYTLQSGGISLDFSKNRVNDDVMASLLALIDESPLPDYREAMFRGDKINNTEQRAVLHTALRASREDLVQRGLDDIAEGVFVQQARMRAISGAVRDGQWRGATGKPLTDVVNLGIGGSDLGPKLACEALKEYAHPGLRNHFVANVDGESIQSLLKALNPETTLVIVASKTFTTQETLLNAKTVAGWFETGLGLKDAFGSPHFIAVTASPETALQLGFAEERVLEFWDWVGGRYSLWSAIGLSIAIAIGFDNFASMLAGARSMDAHFCSAPAAENMPVIMALLGIWYSNFLGAESVAVVPYCERLYQLPFYLQQLDMESNGKSVSRNGDPLDYCTGPILWGLTGTNGQHSFFQLLHQGSHMVPVDFIAVLRDGLSVPEHHRVLLANMFAQSAALMQGKQAAAQEKHRHYSGNRPSNVLLLDALTPHIFGALVALYEHKVFVQGCLWNINSFDQWGVELGKQLARELLDEQIDLSGLDASTRRLLEKSKATFVGSESE